MKWFYSFGADDGKTSSAPAGADSFQTALILKHTDGLAGAQAHREIDFGAQRLRRLFFDHVAEIVFAKLEDPGCHLDTAAIPFA
jgi:hypothetical protein